MKKITVLLLAALLCACSSVNKNTLSYKLSKVNGEKFLTSYGKGQTKEEAQKAAMQEMKKMLTASLPDKDDAVADLYNQALIKETWKDAKTKVYYSIAALNRESGKTTLKTYLDTQDRQISGFTTRLGIEIDKFARIKTAMKLQPLIERRNQLDSLYSLVDYEGKGYNSDKYIGYKNVLFDTLNKVRISLTVLGQNSEILHTHIINALNEMGLSVAINEEADISIDVNSEITEYPSKRLEGLVWCSATATTGIKDMETKGIVARFSISDRQGTGRAQDSIRKTMDEIGKQSAGEIKTKLLTYLERR